MIFYRYEFGVPTQNGDTVTPSCVHQNFGLNRVTKTACQLLSCSLSPFSLRGPCRSPWNNILEDWIVFEGDCSKIFFSKVLSITMVNPFFQHLSQSGFWLTLLLTCDRSFLTYQLEAAFKSNDTSVTLWTSHKGWRARPPSQVAPVPQYPKPVKLQTSWSRQSTPILF